MSENVCADITESISYLKNSLLYQMSLGSKELYHSNVWAWLIEQDHSFVKAFFPDFDENIYTIKGVDRECRHRDLVIWIEKKNALKRENQYCYVVENKIKSLPTTEQLTEYSQDLWHNKFLGGTLTGIENTLYNMPNGWQFVSYNKIAPKIEWTAKQSVSEAIKSHLTQILEYCKTINAINTLLNAAVEESGEALEYWEFIEKYNLNDKLIRLDDVFIKLKGAKFSKYVTDRLDLEDIRLKAKQYHFDNYTSFHNGKATLDFRFSNWKEGVRDYLTIGIQVEGSQYRFIVEKGGLHKAEDIYEEFKNIWFDDTYDCNGNRKIFGRTTSMRMADKFCSYGRNSDDYKFVYQYYNIDESNHTYSQLLTVIEKDLDKAKNIILSRE